MGETIKISKIQTNNGQIEGLPKNPRFIKDERFNLLCENLKKYPKFLEKRPIVIHSEEKPVVIAGNMRFRALKHLGYKEIPKEWVKTAADYTEDELRAFTIIDNVPFGETDWDVVANEWTDFDLSGWGLDLPDFEAVDEEKEVTDLSDKLESLFKIEVSCRDESEQEATYNKLTEMGYQCRVLTL